MHDLTALPNLSSAEYVEQRPTRTSKPGVSVLEEVTALLSDHFVSADRGCINSVVGEEVRRYGETMALEYGSSGLSTQAPMFIAGMPSASTSL